MIFITMHHVQGYTTLQVHQWEKQQFRFIQLTNPVKNTFIFLHFELDVPAYPLY